MAFPMKTTTAILAVVLMLQVTFHHGDCNPADQRIIAMNDCLDQGLRQCVLASIDSDLIVQHGNEHLLQNLETILSPDQLCAMIRPTLTCLFANVEERCGKEAASLAEQNIRLDSYRSHGVRGCNPQTGIISA